MTGLADMSVTFVWFLIVVFGAIGLGLLPRLIRDRRRARERKRAELTSEGWDREGRAVTEMRRGEHVARFE